MDNVLIGYGQTAENPMFCYYVPAKKILDSICMKLTAIGESIKNLDKVTNKELLIHL